MWAQIPMLRVRSKGYSRFGELRSVDMRKDQIKRTGNVRRKRLPAEVSKCAVCLRLLVNIVTLADGIPLIARSILQLVCQSHVHRHTFTIAGKTDNPAKRHRL